MSLENVKQCRDRITHLQDVVGFQSNNGLLSKDEAVQLLTDLKDAADQLNQGAILDADLKSRTILVDLMSKLGNKSRKLRFLYLWGIHVWVFLVILSILLLTLLVTRILSQPIFAGISGDSIAWGGIGATAYSVYFTRMSIYQIQFSKYYAVYWFVYPVAGMVFGFAVAFVVAAGLLPLGANPSYAFYASVAFLAGLLQEWAVGTFRDIANAVHKVSRQHAS